MASALMDGHAEPIRVLMLSHYFAQRRGGIEAVAAALGRELVMRGFKVSWLASGEISAASEEVEYQRVALATTSAAERVLAIPYPLLRPSAWQRIYRESERHDVIVVHDALYMTSVLGALAARWRSKPLVVVQHVGFVPFRSRLLRYLMHVANHCVAAPLLRRADQVVFISQLTQRHFAKVEWRHSPVLVFNGVDTDTFRPAVNAAEVQGARRGLGLPVEMTIALFVGRFVEKKGLQALEHLARLRPELLFVFAGHGPLDPRGWQLPNVRVYSGLWGGPLASLYRAADVLVLPSAGEGFPLVVQEALASGLPIICGTDTAQADPRAAPLLNGVEVELKDPAATAKRVDATLRLLLGQASTQAERDTRAGFAKASYSWSASGARYADILSALCTRRTRSNQC